MRKFDSVNEVLDFAIDNEIGAQNFYKSLAGRSKIPQMKEVFEGFAQEEKGHQTKLENLKISGEFSGGGIEKNVQSLGLADYLVEAEPTGDMEYKDALVLAMKKEKSAYKLYLDLATIAESQDMTDMFMYLAQEEAKHKLRFELEYDDIVLQED